MQAINYITGLAEESLDHEQLMIQLADAMAGAAVAFNTPQGYDAFITARTMFQCTVHAYYADLRHKTQEILHKNSDS